MTVGEQDGENLTKMLSALSPEDRQLLAKLATPRMVEKYYQQAPHPTQQFFLSLQCREALFGGAAGGGKAARVPDRSDPAYDPTMETKVLTPNGFVLLGDVEVGDQVCNPDGTVATVVRTVRMKERSFYRLTFADGASTEAASDHLWAVRDRRQRKRRKVALGEVPDGLTPAEEWNFRYFQRYQIMTTEQVRQRLLDGRSLAVPLTSPVTFTRPKGRWPMLSPYAVGVLLGDGSLSHGQAQWVKPDPEIAARVHTEVVPLGLRVTERTRDGSYAIVTEVAGAESASKHLQRLGLAGAVSATKFVPETYKYRSDTERLALLQGLMDTDGYCDDRGHVEFVTVSEQLALDVQWLLRSLGYTATITKKEAPTYQYKGERRTGQPAYRIYIRGNNMHELFFTTAKKARSVQRVGVGSGDTSGDLWVDNPIVSVEMTGTDPAKCITVDNPNGLYITDDFVVTHNSSALLMSALQYALALDTKVPTPDGWTTIEKLQPGDRVFSPSGKTVTVTHTTAVYAGDCYRLTFKNGQEVIADGDHLWFASDFKDRMTQGPNYAGKRRDGQIVTTRQMYESQATTYKKPHAQWSVARTQPVQGDERELPLDPYLLGLWLGDGCKRDGTMAGTPEDNIRQAFVDRGFVCTEYRGRNNFHVRGLRPILTLMGVQNNKHVPVEYMRASYQQRLELLRGLMDSDGTANRCYGSVRFFNTDSVIAMAVVELMSSLGLNPTWTLQKYRRPKLQELGFGYVIETTSPIRLFNLKRKADLQKYKGTRALLIHKIEKIESQPVKCITVDDPNGLFLITESWIPTHNCDVPGYHALILRRTWPDLSLPGAIMDRAREWLAGTDAKPQEGGRKWLFPSGARLVFGHLQFEKDRYIYQGSDYSFIGFDELTQFEELTYSYLFSRLRKPALPCLNCRTPLRKISDLAFKHVNKTSCEVPVPDPHTLARFAPAPDGTTIFDVPLRARSTSNPGNVGHCVPYGEVLTPSGWRDIRDLHVGAQVYQVAEDGTLEPTFVRQVHEHVADEVVYVNCRGLHMAMTPEHRVAKRGGVRGDTGKLFSLVPWKDMPGQTHVVRAPFHWQGVPIGEFKVPRRIGKNHQPEVLTGVQYAAFMGWFLTEGCLVHRDKTIFIAQTEPRTRAKLKLLLDGCGFTYAEDAHGFTLYAADWYDELSNTRLGREKEIPRLILDASAVEVTAFLDAVMDSDGYRRSAIPDSGIFCTASVAFADGLSEIATKLGYQVRASKHILPQCAGFEYRVHVKRTKNHSTEILTGHHVYDVSTTTQRRNEVQTVSVPTPVYCIGVDSHAFVIRQQGSVWVSGNSWVKQRFIDPKTRKKGTVFVPSLLQDNPSIDRESYLESLSHLLPIERARLERGDWDVSEEGSMFQRHWFSVVRESPRAARRARCWDLAASADKGDYTVGALVALHDGRWFIEDIIRGQWSPSEVERVVRQTAETDGWQIPIRFEQEPGSAGKNVIDHFARTVLLGRDFKGVRPTGSKEVRARPLASAAEAGNVSIVSAPWNVAFIEELSLFPHGAHDDQLDATVLGMESLALRRPVRIVV